MLRKRTYLLIVFISTVSVLKLNAQKSISNPTFNFSNGIGVIAPDSLFSINFRFRTQLRSAYNTVSKDDFSASEIEARVRRLRLRFEGFVINPKLNYYIQLSLSRGDMDWVDNDNSEINSSPNIVRDAVAIYKATEHLTITFGQTKLPGNRQRVVSSGELQFTDRSIVNVAFNIDRDFGLQFAYRNNISQLHYVLKGAISSGEGRNSSTSNAGLAYTGRVEVLPLGEFTNKGDYFEGDIEREKKPKISLAAGYHYNESARRTAGTLGKDLYQTRDLSSFIADFLFKYKGIALSTEYVTRNTNSPITTNSAGLERIIYVGESKLFQLSYLFKNNVEVAGRYARITPYASIQEKKELQKEEIGMGVTKYLRKHRVKLQTQLFYNEATDLKINKIDGSWNMMFQIELGI
ncbi:MAG: porin [Bacteroidota bacterium]